MAKKNSRSARRTRRRGGDLKSMTNEQMQMKGPTHDGVPILEADDVSFMPPHLQSSFAVRNSMKPEDQKVAMAPSQVRKAGRKTRRRTRTRKAKRGGFIPEGGKAFITHAPFAPPDNAFGSFVGTPENTDNSFTLHPSGKTGGKRRRLVKRK
jgi:hypothetical protein